MGKQYKNPMGDLLSAVELLGGKATIAEVVHGPLSHIPSPTVYAWADRAKAEGLVTKARVAGEGLVIQMTLSGWRHLGKEQDAPQTPHKENKKLYFVSFLKEGDEGVLPVSQNYYSTSIGRVVEKVLSENSNIRSLIVNETEYTDLN